MTDTDRLAALLHEIIDDCDQVGWDAARTTDLRPEAVFDAVYAGLVAAGVTLQPAAPAEGLDYDRMVQAGFLDAYLNIRGVEDEAEAVQMLRADMARYSEEPT